MDVTIDIETYYDSEYSLKKMTMTEYIRHPKFKLQSLAIKVEDQETQYYDTENIPQAIDFISNLPRPWTFVGQNTAFDAAALNWHYGVRPDMYADTMSMSRAYWPGESASLDALGKRLFPNDPSLHKIHGTLESFLGVETLTPEQHERMAIYNKRDVDLTYRVYKTLLSFGFPEEELYQVHMIIRMYAEPMFVTDAPLLREAIHDDVTETENAIERALEAVRLRGVPDTFDLPLDVKLFSSNPRYARLLSEVFGLKPPMKTNLKGAATYAFGKKDVPYIRFKDDNPELEPIFIARELAKSTISATRAQTLLNCSNDGALPLPVPLKYYGAATGRYSGSDGINLQNLPRGSRHRLALCAPGGYQVYVADSSNIECLHGDGLVLTDSGLKKLKDIKLSDRLWDGLEWITHDGVICKGERDVITYKGITATPDHVVYLADGTKLPLGEAMSTKAALLVGEIGGQAIREMDSSRQTNTARHEQSNPACAVRLWQRIVSNCIRPRAWKINGLQKLWKFGLYGHTKKTKGAITASLQCNDNKAEGQQAVVKDLQGGRKPIRISGALRTLSMAINAVTGLFWTGSRQNRYERPLRGREHTASEPRTKRTNKTLQHGSKLRRSINVCQQICQRLLSRSAPVNNIIVAQTGANTGTVHRKSQSYTNQTSKTEVWDIINAGPRNRFTYNGYIVSNCRVNASFANQNDLVEAFRHGFDVYSNFAEEVVYHYPVSKATKTERNVGKTCILGLGYGMGVLRFQQTLQSGPMGAPPMECSLELAQTCVYGYRRKYPEIARSWQVAQQMLLAMMDPRIDLQWGPLRVIHNGLLLPNGLFLSYPGLRFNDLNELEYWNGKFWKKIYGANLIENICQCLAGIVIKQAMNNIDRWLVENNLGRIVLQVHDEIIVIAKDNDSRYTPDDIQAKIQEFMCVSPVWMPNLPLDSEGGYAKNYSK